MAEKTAVEREAMVCDQIEARGIRDPDVLRALRMVPRHEFVPADAKRFAYDDSPLSIGHEVTISQPYIVAFMTEAIGLKSTDRVLEVGTGSGYQTAVLAALAREVYTIEIIEPLGQRASELFGKLGLGNVKLRIGDGYQGWPEAAPFDAIVVTAAPDHVPKPLLDQLATDGRLILPVGEQRQRLIIVTKTEKGLQEKTLLPVSFVPMTGVASSKSD